jgi:hypothetical protein
MTNEEFLSLVIGGLSIIPLAVLCIWIAVYRYDRKQERIWKRKSGG